MSPFGPRNYTSPVRSPNHLPGLSLINAAANGGRILINMTAYSVTARTALPAAAIIPGVTAEEAGGGKWQAYGDVVAPKAVPFAVEKDGALGKDARQFV